MILGEVSETFVHIILGATERDDIRLVLGVREGNLHLVKLVSDLLDLAARSPDHRTVEPLLDHNVTALLVLLLQQR